VKGSGPDAAAAELCQPRVRARKLRYEIHELAVVCCQLDALLLCFHCTVPQGARAEAGACKREESSESPLPLFHVTLFHLTCLVSFGTHPGNLSAAALSRYTRHHPGRPLRRQRFERGASKEGDGCRVQGA